MASNPGLLFEAIKLALSLAIILGVVWWVARLKLGSDVRLGDESEVRELARAAGTGSLALELYLSPSKTPKLDGSLPLGRLARRWLFRGAFGKDTRRAAGKALDAAERLDVVALDARWRRR